ncbi:enoyl-CoA hydratase/isomerase family protein [Rhodanobacter caeni]|uniref:Enoyl-CoA hydratase/isomerase family protein n=1 Tax=Rhodanobacter caeni TaxID=657654 RepID=A0ABP3DV33_9GAMM
MFDLFPHEHDITEIRLNRPPVNALDTALLVTLREALEQAPANGQRGLVLSGAQGLFSAGVDIPALLALDRDGVRRFWHEFFALCSTLARLPIPIVAAITGHSPAGGAVLALFCDYRVMAQGPYRIGLNEVQVGLIVPQSIQHALRRVVGTYRAERLLVSGAMIESDAALACGFVDELTVAEQVTTRALHWLGELLALPSQAMLATRALARADLVAAVDPDTLPLDDFLDAYFQPEAQAVLQQLLARLKN